MSYTCYVCKVALKQIIQFYKNMLFSEKRQVDMTDWLHFKTAKVKWPQVLSNRNSTEQKLKKSNSLYLPQIQLSTPTKWTCKIFVDFRFKNNIKKMFLCLEMFVLFKSLIWSYI